MMHLLFNIFTYVKIVWQVCFPFWNQTGFGSTHLDQTDKVFEKGNLPSSLDLPVFGRNIVWPIRICAVWT